MILLNLETKIQVSHLGDFITWRGGVERPGFETCVLPLSPSQALPLCVTIIHDIHVSLESS